MNDSPNPDAPLNLPLPAAPPHGRRRWVSLLLSLVIFASGIVIGAAGAAGFIRREILHVLRDPGAVPDRITQRLKTRLSLTDEQADKVQDILETRQRSLQAIRTRIQPEVVKQLRLAKEEVGDVLDDRQRERWEADFDRLRELWLPSMPARAGPPS
jgi:hypothetical protein